MSEGAKNKNLKSIIAVAIAVLVIACGAGFFLNRGQIYDYISAQTFRPSEKIANVKDSIKLTSRAGTIFYATHPALMEKDAFNGACDSHDDEISVLGCYSGGQIYLYNIEDPELAGVVESTAAHELLHAVWERMGTNEKDEVTSYIKSVYDDEKYHELLAEDLETYEEEERIEELHSRIGTEIADLPAALEEHYAKYFENQDLIVDFYDSYITPFRELSEEIDAMSEKLEIMSAEIDEKTAIYYQDADMLSAEIDQFNACVSTPNCFATDAIFYARRNVLVGKQSALDSEYDALNDLIDQYNALVEEYNANILRGETLERAINSNKKTELVETN